MKSLSGNVAAPTMDAMEMKRVHTTTTTNTTSTAANGKGVSRRNAPTKLMGELGYGKGYLYPHDYEGALVEQTYLPDELLAKRYYRPTDRGLEKKLQEFLQKVSRLHGKG